jgi:hypothetical protein
VKDLLLGMLASAKGLLSDARNPDQPRAQNIPPLAHNAIEARNTMFPIHPQSSENKNPHFPLCNCGAIHNNKNPNLFRFLLPQEHDPGESVKL